MTLWIVRSGKSFEPLAPSYEPGILSFDDNKIKKQTSG